MPFIEFTVRLICENSEPDNLVPLFHGTIFEFGEEVGDEPVKIGEIEFHLLQRGRALNEGLSLFEAADCVDDDLGECYKAVFDGKGETDWSKEVRDLYKGQIVGLDALFIRRIELEPNWRGKGVGAQVVRETISAFSSSCGVVVCKPFPIQYVGWMDEERKGSREKPGFETQRLADFAKVRRFWTRLGFARLGDSDFYAHAPELVNQPIPGGGTGRIQ
ncbi:MAG TPA: hypothetical protein VFZ27_04220 [Terriglobia bacterium]|nr:hypothetical protein [Terriglobia bacterium]